MKRTITILLLLVMIISLVGCAENAKPDNPLTSQDNVQKIDKAEDPIVDSSPEIVRIIASALPEKGYEIDSVGTEEIDADTFIHTIVDYYVIELENGENVYVTVFENAEKAAEHAACYNDDGSHYTSSKISMIIDYAAPVRMWLHEECVIEYGSFENELYLPLCELFGAPFVGKTSIIENIELSDIQYIRTNQIGGEFANNTIVLIESAEELSDYYEANKETFDLERRETVYSDTSVGFLDACDTYTDEWFETNNLLLVIVGEGSGSVRHKITSVTIRNYDLESFNEEDFALQINVQRLVPEIGTCDMAEWHIMIGVPKRDLPEVMGLGVNETWDTDFGWMTEEAESDATESELYIAEIIDESSSGEPLGYEELASEYLSAYKNLQFISYEITDIYSSDEAFELTGNDMFKRQSTLYRVHVYYDHLNDCKTNYYLNIAHAGNAEKQHLGYPIYEVGQRFVSAVFGSSDTWRVPVPELEFVLMDTESEKFAYHLYSEMEISDDSLTFINMNESEKSLITSTENNPMIFTHKFSTTELSNFIRQDWNERGLSDSEEQSLSYFSQGLLAVQVDGLFGYIDKSGEFAIKPQFDSALQFASNGLACVCIDDKFGYINTKGDIVIEPQYDLGYSFEECGLAAVCIDKKFGFIDSCGNYVFKPTFSWVSGAFYTPEGTFGKHGIACVRIGDYPDSKFAFVDINGNYVTEPIFDNAHSFADNGLAAVMISDIHSQKWGYINTSGEYVIQPKEYSYVGDFASNGLANVLTVSGKYGYIDETGKYAIEPRFTYAGDFGENGYAVVSIDSKYGIIDANGNYVIEPKSDYVSNFADNGLAVVKIGAKSGYVNMEGKFVIEPIYIRTGNFVNGLASVNEGRGDGYINEKGEYVIEPREDIYNAYPFDDDGYAVIRGEENWTVINRNGETVFGPFDWINCDSKLWFGQNYESMFEPE